MKEPRVRCFCSCFLGQLKLSIDAQDQVLLLHSEYDYVQAHQGRTGVVPSCLELDRAWYHYGICHLSPDKVGAHLGPFLQTPVPVLTLEWSLLTRPCFLSRPQPSLDVSVMLDQTQQ